MKWQISAWFSKGCALSSAAISYSYSKGIPHTVKTKNSLVSTRNQHDTAAHFDPNCSLDPMFADGAAAVLSQRECAPVK